LPQFADRAEWLYLAVDTNNKITEVQALARKLRLNRRVELIDLDDFYKSWPQLGSPQLIFCRNVFHELDLRNTSLLLSHISSNFQEKDTLIIQDVLRLPTGERHNACWVPGEFEECIRAHGFQSIQCTPQPTRSGNYFFTLLAIDLTGQRITREASQAQVIEARERQWRIWSALEHEAIHGVFGRGALVEALDLDLQFAALTCQLRDMIPGSPG